MILNLKASSWVVGAALLMGALWVSDATAAEFHSEVAKTKYAITGDGNHVLVTAAGTVTCTGFTAEATTTAATNTALTVTNFVYTGAGAGGKCINKTIFGNIEVTVDFTTDECHQVFHSNGESDIECNKAGGITITGPGCSITLPTQTGLKGIAYDNKGAGANRDVTYTAVVKGIAGNAAGFLCSRAGAFNGGETIANATIQGFIDEAGGAQVGMWWE